MLELQDNASRICKWIGNLKDDDTFPAGCRSVDEFFGLLLGADENTLADVLRTRDLVREPGRHNRSTEFLFRCHALNLLDDDLKKEMRRSIFRVGIILPDEIVEKVRNGRPTGESITFEEYDIHLSTDMMINLYLKEFKTVNPSYYDSLLMLLGDKYSQSHKLSI